MFLLILVTMYLIICNVFQISVIQDIQVLRTVENPGNQRVAD